MTDDRRSIFNDPTRYRPKYPDSPFVHIADLVNPETDKTYREENAELKHSIPIGALVEVVPGDGDPDLDAGVRLYVVSHGRDCDMAPLYCLAADRSDTVQLDPSFNNRKWHCGYPEYCLRVVKLPGE